MDYSNRAETTPQPIDLIRILDGMMAGLKRYFPVFFLLIALGGVLFPIRSWMNYTPRYKAAATFTVTAGNKSSFGTGSYYNNATAGQLEKTFPFLLTSGTLSKVVAADLGVNSLNGSISASVMPDTNLFTIEVTSNNAQDACSILDSVIENYPVVAEQVVGSTELEMLDHTGVPAQPINTPNYMRAAVKGAVMGAGVSVLMLLFYVLLRRTVQEEDDLKKVLHLECLGSIPLISLKRRTKVKRQNVSIYNANISQGFLEAMRVIRIRLEKKLQDSHCKVVLVTSAAPGEGKSTVAANLAMAMAMDGNKVLLMDCDIRNPSLNDILGITPEKGVYELLQGEVNLEQAMIYDEERRLYVLPGGKPSGNASEILDSPQMANILSQVRKSMDYIVLDTAPVGMLTDTAVLANLADAALFVVKQDYAKIGHIVEAVEQLAESRVKMAGCVLNGVKGHLGSYGYYSYYHRAGAYSRYGAVNDSSSNPAQKQNAAVD